MSNFAVESDSQFAYCGKFLELMSSERSINKISMVRGERGVGSSQDFAEWMCYQHNLMKLDRSLRGAKSVTELSLEEQNRLLREMMEDGTLFNCKFENIKERWGHRRQERVQDQN
mmetsp:Transcript_8886/g.15083  ORF Transcript_8886/g.15083 Transcript_8886/m.15083 type:complete len:115 (-) Transcript_8886:28-372(-)